MSWEEIKGLNEEMHGIAERMKSIVDDASRENRTLNVDEQTTFDGLDLLAKRKGEQLAELEEQRERDSRRPENVAALDAARRVLGASDAPRGDYLVRDDSFSEYLQRERGLKRGNGQLRGFGDILKHSIETGRKEYRLTSASTGDAGGLVDTFVASDFIDLLRSQSRAFEAGVRMIPLSGEYNTFRRPKLTGDVAPAWRAESAAVARTCSRKASPRVTLLGWDSRRILATASTRFRHRASQSAQAAKPSRWLGTSRKQCGDNAKI